MKTVSIMDQADTRATSREEFFSVIEARRQQIAGDRETLREFQQALNATDRFWTGHPGWSLGQCLEATRAASSHNNPTAPTTEGTH